MSNTQNSSPNRNPVVPALMAVATKAFEAATKARETYQQIAVPYLRKRVTQFSCTPENLSAQYSFENEIRYEFPREAAHTIFDQQLKASLELQRCAEAIQEFYGSQNVEFTLNNFLVSRIHAGLYSATQEDQLADVCAFISDLENNPVVWRISAPLENLFLSVERIEVDCGCKLRLRQPTATDLESDTRSEDYHVRQMVGSIDGGGQPTAILEFNWRSSGSIEAQEHLGPIMDGLRLFRLGAVRYWAYTVTAHTFARVQGFQMGGGFRLGSESYVLNAADVAPFQTFMSKIIPRLQVTNVASSQAVEPVSVALDRYREAISTIGSIEGKIALTVSCLEALYLKAEERSELTHRLAQRASTVLRFANERPIETYKELSRAYGIRSRFIHGGALEAEERGGADALRKRILEFARVSLIVFLQLDNQCEKDKFVSRIDNSLLDDGAKRSLESQIGGMLLPLSTS